MQIALDSLVYLILALALFSLVVAMLPKIEDFGFSLSQPGMTKEEFLDALVSAYMNNQNFTAITAQEITSEEVEAYLSNLSIADKFKLNFNVSHTFSVKVENGVVIVNG